MNLSFSELLTYFFVESCTRIKHPVGSPPETYHQVEHQVHHRRCQRGGRRGRHGGERVSRRPPKKEEQNKRTLLKQEIELYQVADQYPQKVVHSAC